MEYQFVLYDLGINNKKSLNRDKPSIPPTCNN